LVLGGSITALAGAIATVVYVFQPWRTCDYDDTPSACSMLPFDAAVMTVAMVATVLGVAGAVAGVSLLRAERSRRRIEAGGPRWLA